jgi:hypothetical protein
MKEGTPMPIPIPKPMLLDSESEFVPGLEVGVLVEEPPSENEEAIEVLEAFEGD